MERCAPAAMHKSGAPEKCNRLESPNVVTLALRNTQSSGNSSKVPLHRAYSRSLLRPLILA
ncbi:MAG: hypothetical protein NVS9B15_13010 [Acidobacteriaceae bacterium]